MLSHTEKIYVTALVVIIGGLIVYTTKRAGNPGVDTAAIPVWGPN